MIRPLFWMGSSKKDLLALPEDVRRAFGHALNFAQRGDRHPAARPMSGFGHAGVLEIAVRGVGGTFRAVYTVKLAGAVFVLHCFHKKSMGGISTPLAEMEVIRVRLKAAEANAGDLQRGKPNDG